ncbi:TolC family protein [Rudanella lutea]|uniref:TolC family protein n=1 Tax=Rudanella lutea TaxID=451374 RepID=UPI001FE17199|nr:TolC family protein [Rudanella lutea]
MNMRVEWRKAALIGALCLQAGVGATWAQNTQAPNAVSPGVATPGVATPGVATSSAANGVPVLSLQQCVDLALQNNIRVQQGQIQVRGSELQLRQSKFNQLPTVNGFVSQGLSSGRNINPGTNTFVDQAVRSNNFQVGANVPIFQGFQLKNQILQNQTNVQAASKELSATQNDAALLVVQQYLNVLTGAEQLEIARRQLEATQAQLDRTQRLVNAGSLPEANLFDLRAQLANDELAIVNAQNNVDLAKLALLQAMNLPGGQNFEIEYLKLPDPRVETYSATAQQIYEIAVASQPQVLGADLRTQSARRAIDIARAGLYPRLSLNGSLSSLFSSVGLQRRIPDGTVQIPQTVILPDGSSQQIFFSQNNFRFEDYSFFDQLGNNLNRSLQISLNVPIFNQRLSRTQIMNATLQQQNAQLNADNIRLQLRQQIETAYTNLTASLNRYRATQVQVTALEQALRVAESRFNAGALNGTDYNIAKTNLDRARASLVQAKYDYVFRTKILDFYQNKPIAF